MAITNGYTDLTSIKANLGISDSTDDSILETAVEAASRKIDEHCGRRFWVDATDKTRYFTPDHPWALRCGPHTQTADLVSVTSLAVDTTGNGTFNLSLTQGTDYFLGPLGNPDSVYWRIQLFQAGSRCWPVGIIDSVKVVGKFGISSVPTDVEQACLIQAAKIFQVAKDGGGGFSDFGAAGGSLGSMFLERSASMLLEAWVHPLRKMMVG